MRALHVPVALSCSFRVRQHSYVDNAGQVHDKPVPGGAMPGAGTQWRFCDPYPGVVGLFLEPELSDVFRVFESLSREGGVWVYFRRGGDCDGGHRHIWPKARDVAFADMSKCGWSLMPALRGRACFF